MNKHHQWKPRMLENTSSHLNEMYDNLPVPVLGEQSINSPHTSVTSSLGSVEAEIKKNSITNLHFTLLKKQTIGLDQEA